MTDLISSEFWADGDVSVLNEQLLPARITIILVDTRGQLEHPRVFNVFGALIFITNAGESEIFLKALYFPTVQ